MKPWRPTPARSRAQTLRRLTMAASLLWFAGTGAALGEEIYRVGTGDTLLINVFGQEGLSGKFRVGSDGAIRYPLLGDIPVANLTSSEIGRVLSKGLLGRLPSGGSLTVEIAEYSPVFIVGEIEKPGQYQYRPGMIVLELLALGGGLKKAAPGDSRAVQLIQADQDLSDAKIQRFSQRVQRARITAELSETDFKDSPASDDDAISPETRRRIIAAEKSVFELRKSIMQNQLQVLKDQRKSFDREIAALEESIVLHDQEVKLLATEVSTTEQLVQKGLALQPRLSSLKRELSATKRNALELRSFLARSQQRQLEVDQKLAEVVQQRSTEIGMALRELDLTIARTEQKIASSRALVEELKASLDQPKTAPAPSYMIARLDDGGQYVRNPTDGFAQVKPRDILVVDRTN